MQNVVSMFKTILVPVDGSDSANRAAEFGAELASNYDAHLNIVHVLEGGSELLGDAQEAKTQGREMLDEVTELIPESTAISTELIEGDPDEAISNYADEHDADLIVMGRHGRSGLKEHLVGTTTERVLRQTKVPVVTVPETTGRGDITGVSNLLVPTDGSENAERAAPYGADIATHVGATLHLLSVVDVQAEAGAFSAGGVTEDFINKLKEDGREAVDQLAQHVDDSDIAVQSSVMRGVSYEAIEEYVAENDVDLIVMASEGESDIAGQSLGSVTDRVLRTVDVPVLVVV
ncbi:universal stress protein [halophilic archaeon]|nr:universal stress protein [halophilic archaeon]